MTKDQIGKRIQVRKKVYNGVDIGDEGKVIDFKFGIWTVQLDKDGENTSCGFESCDIDFLNTSNKNKQKGVSE